MKKFVDSLKQKSPHIREYIAVFSAFVFTALVAGFWLISISVEYGSPETKTSFKKSLSPFSLLGASVGSALERSKAELSTIDPSKVLTTVKVDSNGVVELGNQTNQ